MSFFKKYFKSTPVLYLGIFFFCVIFFTLSSSMTFYCMDNIFNVYNTKKLLDGLVMYKDFNVITTPLFFTIGSAFLKIFGYRLLSFNIYFGFILGSIMVCFTYLLKKTNLPKSTKIFILCVLILLFLPAQAISYNWLFIIFDLLLIIVELSTKKDDKTKSILSGILLGCAFLTKQSMGIVIGFAYFLYVIIRTKNIKGSLKKLLITGSLFLLTLTPFLIYLIYNNALYDFIDLAFLGIAEFKNNTLVESNALFITIFLAIFNLGIIIKGIKKNDLTNKNELIIPLVGFFNLLFAYPICDTWHCIVGYCISLFYFMIFCYEVLNKRIGVKLRTTLKSIPILCLLVLFSITLIDFYNLFNANSIEEQPDFFKYQFAFLDVALPSIQEVSDWQKQKEKEGYQILFVTPYASIYNLVSGNPGFKYDILLHGNFGLNGTQKVINEIKKLKKENTLIVNSFSDSFQDCFEIHDYLDNTYEKVEMLGEFTVYKWYKMIKS